MTEGIKHIRNPLTIIGIFCALAEVGGTIVLPFVLKENQVYYMWFLIGFPVLLVALFFLTLNFNSRVLYAPSDFRDDTNFLKYLSPSAPGEAIQRTNADFEESRRAVPEGDRILLIDHIAPSSHSRARIAKPAKRRIAYSRASVKKVDIKEIRDVSRERYFFLEELLFNKVKADLKTDLSRDYDLTVGQQTFQFDAVSYGSEGPTIIEFKVMLSNLLNKRGLQDTLSKMQSAVAALEKRGVGVKAILALALHLGGIKSEILKERIQNIMANYHYRPTLMLYDIEALEKEYGIADA